MQITYDPEKRGQTLAQRGLDFAEAGQVFAGTTIDFIDDRRDYGEVRWVTFGWLNGRLVALVWTPRGGARHVISMRKANDREKSWYQEQMDRSR